MSPETRSALAAINRRFYDHFSADFDASRRHPWPGWRRLARRLDPDAGGALAVFDAGCGNGRFGAFLASHQPDLRYLGVDGCDALLSAASARLDGVIAAPELRRLDLLEDDLDAALGEQRFDLVTLFGVLHHVPGADCRRALLQRLSRRLAPAGTLAASVWRLDRTPDFSRRRISWEAYNQLCRRDSRTPIDREQLEPDDVLLSWAGDVEHPRYCHFPNDVEIDSLIAAAGPPLVDRFEADGPTGRDNLYLVWQAC